MFRLNIETDNEAVRSTEDIAVMLSDVAGKLATGITEGFIRDVNGNRVGQWKYIRKADNE